jgi:hypothetical protein
MAKKKAAKKKAAKKASTRSMKKGTKKKSAKKTAKKSAKKKSPKRQSSTKRELINTGRDKRYVRRAAGGQFQESDDVGRSLSMDIRRQAMNSAEPGHGDRGD